MRSAGLTPKDFKQLPKDGARFEALVCQLLEAMGYRILEKPAVGTEGGRDVLVERTLKDEMDERHETVLVQCKHYAHSGKAIGDKEVGVWQNAMARYKARGYLLVTDTRVTENLSRSFREFTEDEANYPKWAAFWDVDEIILHLNKHPDVRDSFFPPAAMKQTPLEDLAAEVRTWLQAIRYKVDEPQRLDDRSMSMIAVMDEGTVKQRVLVRCIGGEITPADVDALDQVLDRKTPQGWLISDKRVSDRARERAAEDEAFQVFTLADFLRQRVWGPYFDALTSLVEKDQIPELYVDLGCYKQEMGEEGHEVWRNRKPSLDTYIGDWLRERGKMHISLLGEFGTGKTWFCRHYAYRQLGHYLEDPANERLPLLITLRAFAKAMTAQQLINDALLEQYKLPFVGSAFEVFQEMNRRGKLLLILDGFDEMARQVDYQTVVDNFWELAELVDENSKVILTSRTEYFRWAKESEKVLGGEEFGRRIIVLSPPKFEVLYLEPFSDDQIREVIMRRLGAEDGPVVAERILGTENLAEMARKPVLVELLLAALDEVSADALENPAQVYLYATNRLLLRNIDTKRTFTTTADKLYFLCELAWEMIKSGELCIHYTDIPERIKAYFGDQIKNQHELDTWDYDLRAQTLLHRDAAGYYEFAHKSLAEYFVAYKFAAELGCLAPVFAQTYCEADGQPCQLPIQPKDITGLAETFGAMALTDEQMRAVRGLLLGVMGEDASGRLWKVIDETRGKTPEQVKYAGGNAATLLSVRDESFKDAELARTVLAGASLYGTDLTGVDLHNACLREVDLHLCTLKNADLRWADLTAVKGVGDIGAASLLWIRRKNYLVVGANDGSVRVRDTETWQETIAISGLCGQVCSVVSTQDGSRLIFGDRGNTAILWDLSLDKEIRRFKNRHGRYHQMALSPDERFLVCVDDEKGVSVFDTHSGKKSKVFQSDKVDLYCVCFSEDGRKLIGGDDDGEITIWDFENGREIGKLDSGLAKAYRVCHSRHNSRFLAAGIGEYEQVGCWSSKTGECIFSFQCESSAVCYAHKEDKFAVGDWDGRIWLFGSESGLLIHKIELERRTIILGITFSPDDRYLAAGNFDDATIRIWDVDQDSPTFGQCLKVLEVKMNCQGMQISSARGLEQAMTWTVEGEKRKGTLLEFFADRGAVLDEEQKRILAELRKRRKAGDQRK